MSSVAELLQVLDNVKSAADAGVYVALDLRMPDIAERIQGIADWAEKLQTAVIEQDNANGA